MRLLVFSDIHSDVRALERLMATEADYYLCAGDLVSWSRGLDKMGEVMKPRAGRVLVMPGNHETAEEIEGFCGRFGFQMLHGRAVELAGVQVAGLGYSNRTPFKTPGEFTDEQLARHLDIFEGLKPMVLVCHCPPQGTLLDRAGEGRHFGSRAVGEFIARNQPAYFFCGHIHEAEGAVEQFGVTVGMNVGKPGYLLDLAKIAL
ncbi:MAG: hypothetical protein FJW40_04510 [Acidobacteria bacterium]|nr:hypothetical protein [Acidobacteriota bacterium]